jgi:hypothetical protein
MVLRRRSELWGLVDLAMTEGLDHDGKVHKKEEFALEVGYLFLFYSLVVAIWSTQEIRHESFT